MQDLNSVAHKTNGATNYTHMFISISTGRKLNNFSMRSLFFQIHIHPNFLPLISHSVWCHTQEINFNTAFSIELSKLHPLTLEDLSISFNLYWKQLQSSSLLGITTAKLNDKSATQNKNNSLLYFYDQSPLELTDPNLSIPVGTIYVTIAVGNLDHLNMIEPQKHFISAQIIPINKKSGPKSLIWLQKAQENKWVSRKSIEANWMEIAIQHGWKKRQGQLTVSPIEYLRIDTSDDDDVDLLNQQGHLHSDHIFKYLQPKSFDFIKSHSIVDIEPYEIPKRPIHNKLQKTVTTFDNFNRRNYSYQYKTSKQTDSDFDSLINNYFKENPTPDLASLKNSKSIQTKENHSSWNRETRLSKTSPLQSVKSGPLIFRNSNIFHFSSDSDESKDLIFNEVDFQSDTVSKSKARKNLSLEDLVQQEFDKLSKSTSPQSETQPSNSLTEDDAPLEKPKNRLLSSQKVATITPKVQRKRQNRGSITPEPIRPFNEDDCSFESRSSQFMSDDPSSNSYFNQSSTELFNLSMNDGLNNSKFDVPASNTCNLAKTTGFSPIIQKVRRIHTSNFKEKSEKKTKKAIPQSDNEKQTNQDNFGQSEVKRVPKKPIILTPPPLESSGSPKKEIMMSPSLERMINGIDALSIQLNMSDIESDSDE